MTSAQAIVELQDRGASPEAVKRALCSIFNVAADRVKTQRVPSDSV
jgi:hypothetical protein